MAATAQKAGTGPSVMLSNAASMPIKKFTLTLRNDLSELAKLNSFLEEIQARLSISKKCLLKTNLALEELFSNILSYAFNDDTDHLIKITVTAKQCVLDIRVEDDGKPFNPLEADDPDLRYDIENCPLGGLGIHLVKSFMDDIRYKRNQNRNVLAMRKEYCFDKAG
jgi:anti-sigma regulatory factor (Ser/Thr protein kinase)